MFFSLLVLVLSLCFKMLLLLSRDRAVKGWGDGDDDANDVREEPMHSYTFLQVEFYYSVSRKAGVAKVGYLLFLDGLSWFPFGFTWFELVFSWFCMV